MTNQEKFIQVFGMDAWQQMIVFSGLAEQFKEYWTSPYKDGYIEGEKSCVDCKFWLLDKNDENRRCRYCVDMDEWISR